MVNPMTLDEWLKFPLFFLPIPKTVSEWRAFRFDINVVLRLNSFPEEDLYTLIVDGVLVGSFNDWPSAWKKS